MKIYVHPSFVLILPARKVKYFATLPAYFLILVTIFMIQALLLFISPFVRLARRYFVAEVTYFRVQCFPARCNQEKLIVDDDVYPICVPGQHEAIDPNLQNLLVNDT